MKKLFMLLCLTVLSIGVLSAQEKVKKEVVSSTYNRPSVSYVIVDRNWDYASDVRTFFNTLSIGEKYDHNLINTRYLDVPHYTNTATTSTSVTEAVNSNNLGKEVISYLFHRDSKGNFDDSIIRERGLYNATDQDVRNLTGAKVQEQTLEWGEPLVNTSYVVVLDIYETKATTLDNGDISYTAKCAAHAYKLNGDKEVLNNFYTTGWADESYSDAERAAAVAAYNDMKFELVYVTSVNVSGSSTKSQYSDGDIYEACKTAYSNVVYNLEKKIPGWMTTNSVISVNPIAAKIGTKESLKNGDRFQAYSYKEDRNGNLKSVKHGMVRATVIANNRGVASGNTKPSYFYQISGVANIKEGYVLKQKNDLKLGAALTAGMYPNGLRVGADLDYIGNIAKNGQIGYGMVNFGLNFVDETVADSFLMDASVGAGYGIPLTRFCEVTPLVMIGAYLQSEEVSESDSYNDSYYYDSYYEEEDTSDPVVGYIIEPGIRVAATFQPLSIFLNAGYHLAVPTTEYVNLYSGVYVKFGVKWTF